ncbi:hypothetical protein NQ318_018825 [Aromia moschata]|uniref:Sodium channel protein n=1 Tax=Aromia moschata TaxID=1265417 RepID=A0AAV8ZGD1_9CUCU|nr:hypothetical protein NQ318_018825 [Aromia moschata]
MSEEEENSPPQKLKKHYDQKYSALWKKDKNYAGWITERKKELVDHREDSTFSFDPSSLNVKKLSRQKIKKIDSRKGVLLSSYSRKKTRLTLLSSVTPSRSPSPKHSQQSQGSPRPQALPLPLPPPKHIQLPDPRRPDTLHPHNTLGPNPNRLGFQSRQASSNSGEGNNRESSLDDSGVVDDHEPEGDATSEDVASQVPPAIKRIEVTPVTVAVSPKEIKVIKCNGVGNCKKKKELYALQPDYLSHIVVIRVEDMCGDDNEIPDRNCSCCEQCCMDYDGWLQFQQGLYQIVRDPLFELAITVCIVLNTMFLAMEHHGMSESVLRALDIGNKASNTATEIESHPTRVCFPFQVFTSIFTFECCLKIMALSKDFFYCGWNIFDLIIVSASLLDLIFELVDGLSVLRGLRLLRVLKLAQSWITMKVLLSIIISTIGALGNLTFVLVIVIYIFAVIGMQLFSKDYTEDKFLPDPIPRTKNLFDQCYGTGEECYRVVINKFNEKYPEVSISNVGAKKLVTKFLETGSVLDIKKSKKWLNDDDAASVLALHSLVFKQNQILPFKPKFRHTLEEGDEAKRLDFCLEMGNRVLNDVGFHKRILFSDESTFSTNGIVSSQHSRWNFTDFFHSFMMIFRILCGEWIEPLWDCMRAESKEGPGTCLAVFLPTLVMGNFMVLNLFLALLLNSFNSEELKTRKEEVGDESKLAQSFQRIRDLVRKRRLAEQRQNENNSRLEQIVREVMQRHAEEEALKAQGELSTKAIQQTVVGFPRDKRSYQEAMNRPISIISYEPPEYQERIPENERANRNPKNYTILTNGSEESAVGEKKKGDFKLLHNTSSGVETETVNSSREENTENADSKGNKLCSSTESDPNQREEADQDKKNCDKSNEPGGGGKPWQTLVSYVDELTVGGRRNSKGVFIDSMGVFPGFGKKKPPKVAPDCFPSNFYDRCACLNKCSNSKVGQRWANLRKLVLDVVDTAAFEWFILVLIFASSVTLCFEDIHLDKNPDLKSVLYWTNLAFSVIFIIEMFLKWIALGFHKYFTSFWTLLDFLIVFVSLFSLLIEENENLRVLRSLRTLRALRPLRAISRWQGMRIVVNALMYAIPSIFNVLLVCLVFWLIFSIMGVQFFSGKFFKCVDEEGERLNISIVENKWDCDRLNYTWINSKISFDHVGIAYLALFQVATFEGWMEVMADAVDARGVDLQPQREANLYAYIYFVIFIVCGSFFTLNLFIGVIIDNFNMLKKKYEGGVLEMFLTESQKHYYTAMKKLGRKKPQKVIKRPMNQFLAMFYDLSNSRRFEIAIFVLIFLNMLTMGIEHYGQPHAVFFILEVSNAFFTTVFGLEAIVKIIGLRYHYFTVPWNVFDFLLVLASILGILMEDIMIDFPCISHAPPSGQSVQDRAHPKTYKGKCLVKAAKGIRKLLFALIVSLPALFNIGALLALITFIYAIIGMFLFGHVRQQGALDDMVNFETFGRSMHLLFRLITSAGWNDVLESLMIEYPDCDPHYNNQSNGDCGYPLLAIIYFTSFIIINYMIVINMYIAIILENFNQAHQEEEIGIVEDDLEMFYIRWSKYDPHATQFIRFSQLSDFIASLDPPLGISKPNTVALVSFNLPIAKGNKIHCLDILHALVKHVLGHVEETENFRQLGVIRLTNERIDGDGPEQMGVAREVVRHESEKLTNERIDGDGPEQMGVAREVLQEQMSIKFKKQFPTRKELEIVSSTRIWKRQDKAARLVQKTYRDYVKRKKEKEREAEEVDETTQTSSPGGGWQGRLSAFLHVHRGSRASSRKSSRASDASDLSELGGPWLNLPLLLLSSATNMSPEELDLTRDAADVSIKVSEATPETGTTPVTPTAQSQPRRRSTYSFPFFLKHQDAVEAVDGDRTSPLLGRKELKHSGTSHSLHPAAAEEKPKRGSIVRRKRVGSVKARPTTVSAGGGCQRTQSEKYASSDVVSILVTEASPEGATCRPPLHRQNSEATVVQVLVHRESEEYNNEEEAEATRRRRCRRRATTPTGPASRCRTRTRARPADPG